MKKFYLLELLLFVCMAVLNAQTPYYYYYEGKKQYLELDTKYLFISVSAKDTVVSFASEEVDQTPFQVDISVEKQTRTNHKRFYTKLSFADNLSEREYMAKMSEIKNSGNDIIVSPYFKDGIGLSNFFYVQLKSLSDTILLKQEAEKENMVVVYQNKFMPLWYVVSVTAHSRYNAMQAASYFYETGLFQCAEPDLMLKWEPVFELNSDWISDSYSDFRSDSVCANDSLFHKQWNLKNEGYGIKACDAWQLSTGAEVFVALLDEGVKLDHPDLEANTHLVNSYDVESASLPQVGASGHGTACAGILCSVRNNNEGIAGVAPDSKLMSVSYKKRDNDVPLELEKTADGINWAWDIGKADVISISRSHNNTSPPLSWQVIEAPIHAAVTQGRNGLGTIVVFSSGNAGRDIVNYPSRLPNVIAVGAINSSGGRGGFSNYGYGLNVVAPGCDIYYTVANGSYSTHPGATSWACPHVSGVAALVLSANPYLTQKQVQYIIESTCTKLPGYTFTNDPAHPNGTWNDEVGYGLVNAYAAVLAAQCYSGLPIVYGTIFKNTTWNTNVHAVGTITIPNNVTLTINSTVQFDYGSSIIVEPGAKLIINNGLLTNACSEKWNGVTVMGNPSLPINQQNQGYVQITGGGTIENAVCAISVQGGGIVETNNAIFTNNQAGIKFQPLTTVQSGTSGTLTNATFTLNSSYIGSTSTFETHLKMDGCGQVNVTWCTFSSSVALTPAKGIIVNSAVTNWTGTNQLQSVPVYVQASGILNNYGTVCSGANTSITVQAGGLLVVDSGHLKNISTQLWTGVILEGNSTQRQLPEYQGTIELKNGARISNAICAIDAGYYFDYTRPGGIIYASNTTFYNNVTAIALYMYENKDINGNICDNESIFTECNFVIDFNNYFNINNQSFTQHVTLHKVRNIKFYSCTFEGGGLPNGRGILSLGGGFILKAACTNPFVSDCVCSGQFVSRNYFDELACGIRSYYDGDPYTNLIDKTTFWYNDMSVDIQNYNNYQLTRSQMFINNIGLRSVNASGFQIEDNSFAKAYHIPGGTKGIVMNNSGASENIIYNNSIGGHATGIQVENINGEHITVSGYDPQSGIGWETILSSTGLLFQCNQFNNNSLDISVNPNSTVRVFQKNSAGGGVDNKFNNTGFYFIRIFNNTKCLTSNYFIKL